MPINLDTKNIIFIFAYNIVNQLLMSKESTKKSVKDLIKNLKISISIACKCEQTDKDLRLLYRLIRAYKVAKYTLSTFGDKQPKRTFKANNQLNISI